MTIYLVGDIASAPDGQLYRVEALRTGHWDYPGFEDGLDVTPGVLRELAMHFADGAKGVKVPVDGRGGQENAHSDADADDCGWVTALELTPDGNHLHATFSITDPATRKLIDDGTICFASSELDLAWDDPEDGKTKRVFEGLALTNRPYIKRMQPIDFAPIALSESAAAIQTQQRAGSKPGKEARMPSMTLEELERENAELKTKLKEQSPKDKDGDRLEAKLAEAEAKRKTELAEHRASLDELRAENRKLAGDVRMERLTLRLKRAVTAGKLTPPAYKQTLALAAALIASPGGSVITLAEKTKLDDESDATDKLDVVDRLMDIVDNLPSAIATDGDDDETDDDQKVAADDPSASNQVGDLDKKARAMMADGKATSYREAVAKLTEAGRSRIGEAQKAVNS